MFTLETSFSLPDELISFVRLLSMPKVEWERTRDKGKFPKPKTDIDVLRIAEIVLRKRLEDYKTSLNVRGLILFLFASSSPITCRKMKPFSSPQKKTLINTWPM